MNCEVCRGACCESFSTEIAMMPANGDAMRWLELHATVARKEAAVTFHPNALEFTIDPLVGIPTVTAPGYKLLTFECRCTQLTDEGRCGIWEDRPMVCELFVAGSRLCLETVRQRRTSDDYQRIRSEDDPKTLEV